MGEFLSKIIFWLFVGSVLVVYLLGVCGMVFWSSTEIVKERIRRWWQWMKTKFRSSNKK